MRARQRARRERSPRPTAALRHRIGRAARHRARSTFGGNGLIGAADAWPTLADTPANRAFAVEHADQNWMQFDTFDPNGSTAIRMSCAGAQQRDRGLRLRPRPRHAVRRHGVPHLGLERRHQLDRRRDQRHLRDGFDRRGQRSVRQLQHRAGRSARATRNFAVTGGNHLANVGQDTEGEIDAVYACGRSGAETYALFGAGLGSADLRQPSSQDEALSDWRRHGGAARRV